MTTPIPPLRGAVIGCGFFAANHLHAWGEVTGARCVAVCDLDAHRAAAAAQQVQGARAYTDVPTLLREERPDFVDVVTQPGAHRAVVELAAAAGVHVICQKPLAPALPEARAMVEACRAADVRLMVHENFRWQSPLRAVAIAAREVGPLCYGRISFRSAFDVYRDQPYLADDPRFILADLGVHLLDLARFFLGEVEQLYCVIQRVNPRIRGEDTATVLLRMRSGAACVVDMSYGTRPEIDCFPQTLVQLEGPGGSVSMGPHYRLGKRVGPVVEHTEIPPRRYSWSRPPAEAIQESVVAIQQHWVDCLRGGSEPETSGEDNLRTLALVEAAYESAAAGRAVALGGP